jgi:hypothetical protein
MVRPDARHFDAALTAAQSPVAAARSDLPDDDSTSRLDQRASRFGWLAVDPKRKRLVSFTGGLFVFDLQTAERKQLGGAVSVRDGTQLGLTLDVDGDRLLLADVENGLASLDLDTGAYKQLSAPGSDFELVFGLAAVPHRQLALVLSYGALVVVDLSTGERVIIS